MPNGECVIGAKHGADIENLKAEVEKVHITATRAHGRIDSMKNWLIGVLVAVIVTFFGVMANLAYQIMNGG